MDEMLRVRGGPDTFDNLSGKTCRFPLQHTIKCFYSSSFFFFFLQKITIFVSFFLKAYSLEVSDKKLQSVHVSLGSFSVV